MARSFPLTETQLTASVLAYKNAEFVQDILAPRVPVSSEKFSWFEYPKGREFAIEDSKVGNYGEVNRITSSFSKKTASVDDYALEEALSFTDLDEAPKGVDLRANELQVLIHYLGMAREKRVASLYSNSSNYGSKTKTADTDKWTKDTADIYSQLQTALNSTLIRPNVLVLNQGNWSRLRNHKSIKAALGGFSGVASLQQVTDLFELDKVVVVKARQNSAAKGKTVTIKNLWDDTVSVVYISPNTSLRGGATFCLTASREKGQQNYEDAKYGAKGAYIVKAFDRCKELIISKECGAILTEVSS